MKNNFVVFKLEDQKFALPLASVERIVRIVEISPLPRAPKYVKGIVVFQEKMIPVLDIRKLFRLNEKEVELNDQLIIAKTSLRSVALWVDSVSDVIEKTDEEVVQAEKIFYGIEFVKGIFQFGDGIVLLQDLDEFLTDKEIDLLNLALQNYKKNEQTPKQNENKKNPTRKK